MRLPKRITTEARDDLRVVVEHQGVRLADSRRPVILRETGHRARHYLPAEDVRLDMLEPIDHRTTCPYKGEAEHLAHAGAEVGWVYREVIPGGPPIAGLIAFYERRVDLRVTPA